MKSSVAHAELLSKTADLIANGHREEVEMPWPRYIQGEGSRTTN